MLSEKKSVWNNDSPFYQHSSSPKCARDLIVFSCFHKLFGGGGGVSKKKSKFRRRLRGGEETQTTYWVSIVTDLRVLSSCTQLPVNNGWRINLASSQDTPKGQAGAECVNLPQRFYSEESSVVAMFLTSSPRLSWCLMEITWSMDH